MIRCLTSLCLVVACTITSTPDLPKTPNFTMFVEPETVRARLNAQQRIQLDFLVRILNDGPGKLFVPLCGHEIHRSQPNGSWQLVYVPPCPTGFVPPFAVAAGEGFGYVVRITSPIDSGPWRPGSIAGRYRAFSYISAEFRSGGAWGRPIETARRFVEFPVREQIP